MLDRPGGYRERIYGSYVSAFKGRPDPQHLRSDFSRQASFFDHLLRPAVAAVRPRKMLDIACGQGRLLFWAERSGIPDARGFDVSGEQIEVARSLGLNAEVAVAADYLTACDRDFDLVVAMDIVEHFTRDEALLFLERCYDCIRPGGALFVTTPNGGGWRVGPVAHGDLTHETIFTPQTISLALKLSGFEDIRVREVVPAPTSVRSRVRRLLWQGIRLVPAAIDVIEKGSAGDGIYSRVMAVVARKPGVATKD